MENNNISDNRENNGKWLDKIKKIKHKEIIIAIVVIMVAILTYTFYVNGQDKVESKEVTTSESLTAELEQVLGAIKGVGDVKLLIVYNGGDRLDIAYDENKTTTVIEEDGVRTEITEDNSIPIMVNGDEPLVIGTKRAEIDGVLVVCEGGDDQAVRVAVMQAISTLLKVDYNSINVLAMA